MITVAKLKTSIASSNGACFGFSRGRRVASCLVLRSLPWLLLSLSGFVLQTQAAVSTGKNEAEPVDAKGAYLFIEGLALGSLANKGSLSRFNRGDVIESGTYDVDLYVNGRLYDRQNIRFDDVDGTTRACLSGDVLTGIGIAEDIMAAAEKNTDCQSISSVVAGATERFDFSRLRLDLSIPQIAMNTKPRGYVDPKRFESGDAIGFVNYNASQYYASTTVSFQNSTYVSTNSGLNLGLWRLRQQGSMSYDPSNGYQWNSVRTYVKRALPGIRGELSFGENYTSGVFFSGVAYQGIELASDDRMLPESQRGYAPVIRGVARTNAQVSVHQNGQEIYRTTVAPGPFEISDLYPTSYNGDLDVTVLEADGTRSQFSVPFAAVPESMRPGASRYSFTLGRTRDAAAKDLFADVTYQYGLSNSLTPNGGLRISNDYQAVAMGVTHVSALGALGLNTTYSHAVLAQGKRANGWMAGVTYSKTFQRTETTFSLASYRYSTQNYRELGDVQSERRYQRDSDIGLSSSYRQRSRFDISLNQRLGKAGSLYLSGLTQDYYGSSRRVTQLQAGYTVVFENDISLSLAFQRQRVFSGQSAGASFLENTENRGSSVVVTVFFPLGPRGSDSRPFFSSSVNRANGENTYQASVSGTLGQGQSMNYGLDVNHAHDDQNTIGGNLHKQFANVSMGINASHGPGYWQAAASARGAVAIHSGGITFGPYLSDTFALIEAKGATGAKVFNGQGTAIDSNGYALMPSLVPYQRNQVGLMPEGMNSKVELNDGQRQVVPYAGAAIKVRFKTRSGNALLIKALREDGNPVPMGADVLDEQGVVIGMVGQGSQTYVRTGNVRGRLMLRWGEAAEERCELHYDVQQEDQQQPLLKLKGICESR